jgi:CO/xanthine dehydrogenase Mo-binding subunit
MAISPVVRRVNQARVIASTGLFQHNLPEEDTQVNPLGVKGIGEIGIVGMNAAVANAVFHATGKRIRDLPIRI